MSEDRTQPDWLATAPDLSRLDGTPVHAAITHWLTDLMARGDLVAGDRLPREDRFASLLGVSRMTLRQALAALQAAGTLERRAGRNGGTFIREARIDCDLTGLAGFTVQMRRANLRAGARVISARTVAASRAVASALSLPRAAPVHEVVRVRTARREPLALERSYFPSEAFPDLLAHRLTGSLYELLGRRYGQVPASAAESLEPVIAGQEEADLLHIAVAAPLMLIERTAYTAAGRPVEFARDLFRPDRIRIFLRTGLAAPGPTAGGGAPSD